MYYSLCYLVVFCQYNLKSTSLIIPEGIKISNFTIEGDPLPGNVIKLIVEFNPNFDDTFFVKYKMNGHISLTDTCPYCVTEVYDTLQLDSGEVHIDTLELKPWTTGSSLITAMILPENEHIELNAEAYRYVGISTFDSTFRIIYDDSSFAEDVYPDDSTQIAYEIPRHYRITGRVIYFDLEQRANRGLWKTEVEWWLIWNNNNSLWRPPYEGDATALCDINGNFTLDFTIHSELNPNNDYKILLKVHKSNIHATIPEESDGEHYIIHTSQGEINTFGNSEAIIIDIDENEYYEEFNNLEIEVNSIDGAILRNTAMTANFIWDRYNEVPPIIKVERVEKFSESNIAGKFLIYCNLSGCIIWIMIRNDRANSRVIMHEYGHYVHLCMCGLSSSQIDNYIETSSNTKEGWAIFYSFASKSYANKHFSEELDIFWWDNTEMGPFIYDGVTRFGNYTYRNYQDYCRFAGYLWNIYDSYSDSYFMHSDYDGFNNDDVSNLGWRVFEILHNKSNSKPTPSEFHSYFKENLDNELSSSIDDIWDFMQDDEHLMRPAQIGWIGLFEIQCGQPAHPCLQLRWDSQSYQEPQFDEFNNYEEGYHVYKFNSQSEDWDLIGTTQDEEFTIDPQSMGLWKVSAFNSSGDSYGLRQKSNPPSEKRAFSDELKFSKIKFSCNPNPFNKTTNINYYLPISANVQIDIFDEQYKHIKNLFDGYQGYGEYNVEFVPNNIAIGNYFARIIVSDKQGNLFFDYLKLSYMK